MDTPTHQNETDDLTAIHKAQHAGPEETCLRCRALREGQIHAGNVSPAASPEPPPLPSGGPAVWDLVLADMAARDLMGAAKHGQRLTVGDGRRSLVDMYQELLDAVAYVRKEIAEGPANLQAAYDRGLAEGRALERAALIAHLTGGTDG